MQIAEYCAGDEHLLCRRGVTRALRAEGAACALPEATAWRRSATHPDAESSAALTPALWGWRHGFAPRPSPVYVAREGRDLLGYAAAVPTLVVLNGTSYRAAQIFSEGTTERGPFVGLHLSLFEQLRADGVHLAYHLASEGAMSAYHGLELTPLFELHARNLYVGLNAVSARLDARAFWLVRRLAQEVRRVRTPLFEVALDDGSLGQAARLLAADDRSAGFGLAKDEAWLRWRYVERPDSDARMLVLRRRAGKGIDAFAIVRLVEVRPGRTVIQLLDHGTRTSGRRALAWLLGEVAVWGLAEKADVIQGYAASGSDLDHVLVGSGFLRKKRPRLLMAKWLGPRPSPIAGPFTTRRVALRSGDVEL